MATTVISYCLVGNHRLLITLTEVALFIPLQLTNIHDISLIDNY